MSVGAGSGDGDGGGKGGGRRSYVLSQFLALGERWEKGYEDPGKAICAAGEQQEMQTLSGPGPCGRKREQGAPKPQPLRHKPLLALMLGASTGMSDNRTPAGLASVRSGAIRIKSMRVGGAEDKRGHPVPWSTGYSRRRPTFLTGPYVPPFLGQGISAEDLPVSRGLELAVEPDASGGRGIPISSADVG